LKSKLESIRFDSITKKSTFESISHVGIVESNRFQKLKSKPDPTVSLDTRLRIFIVYYLITNN